MPLEGVVFRATEWRPEPHRKGTPEGLCLRIARTAGLMKEHIFTRKTAVKKSDPKKNRGKKSPVKKGDRNKPEGSGASNDRDTWLTEHILDLLNDTLGALDEWDELSASTQIRSIEDREHLSLVMLTVPEIPHDVCSVVSFEDPENPTVVGGYVHLEQGKLTLGFYLDEGEKPNLPDAYSPK